MVVVTPLCLAWCRFTMISRLHCFVSLLRDRVYYTEDDVFVLKLDAAMAVQWARSISTHANGFAGTPGTCC